MAIGRDWIKTLWSCSYRGAFFYVESDGENGGRRLVKHLFPMRDDPYLEDLGEDLREYEVTAYLASDTADSDAAALMAVCTSRGAGVLILPTQGPVFVRSEKCKRDHRKDKLGYIAFSLNFTREGATSALASVSSFANLIFVAADQAAAQVAASFATNFAISGLGSATPQRVDFVVQSAVDNLQFGVSMVEAIRATSAVEPTVDAAQQVILQSVYDLIPDVIEDDPAAAVAPIIASARAIAFAMIPATALAAYQSVMTDPTLTVVFPPIYPTKNLRAATINEAAAKRAVRLAALVSYAETIARMVIPDRPTGITLRANVAELFEAEIVDLPASEIDLLRSIELLGDNLVNYLSRSILDLSPVVVVTTNLPLPSLAAAWRLYQDPTRYAELVTRNRVVHPSFMPTTYEALAR